MLVEVWMVLVSGKSFFDVNYKAGCGIYSLGFQVP